MPRLYRHPRVGNLATMIVGPTAYPVTIVGVSRDAGRVTICVCEDSGRASIWRRRVGGRYSPLRDSKGTQHHLRLGQ